MKKVYVCIGYGHKKETNEPYSKFAAVVKGREFGYYSFKDTFYIDEIFELGEEKVLTDEE